MRAMPAVFALLSAMTLYAQDRISVSVCNFARVSSTGLTKAEIEVTMVFRHAGVEITWDKMWGEDQQRGRLREALHYSGSR